MTLFSTGGTIDGAFDFLRDDLGAAVSFCVPFLKNNVKINIGRSDCGRVLFNYSEGVKTGAFSVFAKSSDSQLKTISEIISSSSGVSVENSFYVLYACNEGAKSGNSSCARVINAQSGTNIIDTLQYKGVTGAISSAVSGAVDTIANALGIPRSLITIVLIVGVAYLSFILIRKVKKL
jgi:hypothetical protein